MVTVRFGIIVRLEKFLKIEIVLFFFRVSFVPFVPCPSAKLNIGGIIKLR